MTEHDLLMRCSWAGYKAFAQPCPTGTRYLLFSRKKDRRKDPPLTFNRLPDAIEFCDRIMRLRVEAREFRAVLREGDQP